MIDLVWYLVSFTLGGIVGAPIFLTYGFFLLQRYINRPEPEKLLEAPEGMIFENQQAYIFLPSYSIS